MISPLSPPLHSLVTSHPQFRFSQLDLVWVAWPCVRVLYSCVFAYGQTGSGKSYTMMGAGGGGSDNPERGLTPRLCEDLFQQISTKVEAGWTAKVEVSYMEIYLEMVRDLLSSNPDRKLKVREHKSTGPYVEDLSSHAVTSYKEVKALMDDGDKVRVRGRVASAFWSLPLQCPSSHCDTAH